VYDGMAEKETETISVYPNPMRDVLFVGTNNGQSVQCVEVFNVTGQRVISSTETEIKVSELGAGVYFVRVTIDDKIMIHRIVKQ